MPANLSLNHDPELSARARSRSEMWDVNGNCAKGRSKEALQINRELDNIKAQIIKHYQHLSDREAFMTAEMVRNSYQGFGSEYETLLSAYPIVAYVHKKL